MKKDTLINKFLPRYTFNEYHEIVIDAPIDTVYKMADDLDLSKSKTISWLFKIRGLPTNRMNLRGFIHDMGFTPLEANPPHERLIGFWTRVKIEPVASETDFLTDSISPWIKAVWNFQFEKLGQNKTRLSTETRVLCVASFTKVTFRLYWWLIKPFSGLTRKKMLRIVKEDSENAFFNG